MLPAAVVAAALGLAAPASAQQGFSLARLQPAFAGDRLFGVASPYTASDSGVYLWNQRAGTSPAGRIIFFLPLPDIGALVPVRETEVSPDLREYVQSHAAKELDKLRAMMKEEGFRPTTKPTQPSNEDL